MKELFIHIGLSKTGSSAIQSWLSLNLVKLEHQGINYADLSPSAKEGKVTAGNGVALFQACNQLDWLEVERLILQVYFGNQEKAIISSETLQNIKPDAISKINEIAKLNNIKVHIIAYARSVYELLYSNYLQGVKRHGFSFKFGEREKLSYKPQREFLENYYNVFKSQLILINYDSEKNDIFGSFSKFINFDQTDFEVKNKKVNRSLTFSEAEMLTIANGIHGGFFSTEISDYIINLKPDIKTSVFYSEELLDSVIENSKDDLNWINTNLNPHGGSIEICLPRQISHNGDSFVSKHEVVESIVKWARLYGANFKNKDKITHFLRDFATSLEGKNLHSSYVLMCEAQVLRPNGPFINNKILEYAKELNIKKK